MVWVVRRMSLKQSSGCEQGNSIAQTDLADCYETCNGVVRDLECKVKWYRLATEQGSALAQNNLGVSYKVGEGVAQDIEEAARLYRLSAEQGYDRAQEYRRVVGELL